MIGNDLVDLSIALAENKSGNQRFLEKVFLPEEIELIKSTGNPEILLWRMWSMKETVYKASQRISGFKRKLNPLDFRCEIHDSSHGRVYSDLTKFSVVSENNKDFIHSYTFKGPHIFKVVKNHPTPNLNLYLHIVQEMGSSEDEFSIEKNDNGIPFLWQKKTGLRFPISLSHHGNFSAFLFPLINS